MTNSLQDLKQRVCSAIDDSGPEICGLGDDIMENPEPGFTEFRTAKLVLEKMQLLGLRPQPGMAITGVKSRLRGAKPGPTLAIIGELDSLRTPGHPLANPKTNAAHTCGHNAQIAALMGAAIGLIRAGAAAEMYGDIVFFAVPAEELIDIDDRLALVQEGKIEFVLGKPELISKGGFDDIDLAMMIHIDSNGPATFMFESSNGAVVKRARFVGRAAHAGTVPQRGINALNAALLALQAMAMLRETFWEKDFIRIHPIITKGGDAVSVVPSDVTVETFVRGASLEAILDADLKVDRCLRAGAMAVGAEVVIETIPGYLPQRNNRPMGDVFGRNADWLLGSNAYVFGGHRSGSTDMGDLGHLIPVIHPYIRAADGIIHGSDWRLVSHEAAYLNPAKLLALTAIDLLCGNGEGARQVVSQFSPAMTKTEYLSFERRLFRKERYAS
jgi:amidohydrolase